jgi:hypothetical protein
LRLAGRTQKPHVGSQKYERGFVPGGRGAIMKEQGFDRRDFLKTAVVGGAAAAGGTAGIVTPEMAQAQQPAATAAVTGYAFLNLDEAAFVEALVDHMIPADHRAAVRLRHQQRAPDAAVGHRDAL